jgi:hypothetical protein
MPEGNIEKWLRQSQWVIRGTVEKLHAATLRSVPASDHTAVVKVDEILHGPKQFADHRGRQITMYSNDPQGLTPGKQAIFFTQSWLYGESLAVKEVGRLEEGTPTAMEQAITEADHRIADDRLQERIVRAELVIVGKVVKTQPASFPGRRRVETEHDPDWWEASIEVQSVELGIFLKSIVAILFARSMDELWIDSPKCQVEQQGIWILQRDQKEKGWPVLRMPGLTALDPLDFQPKEQLERVRRLIRQR